MSMTETPAAEPKAKRKPVRKPKATAAPAEFAGMTGNDCCADCTEKKCVITGIGICGHPMKGGLQAPLMVKPEVVARYNRARKVLAKAKVEMRYG